MNGRSKAPTYSERHLMLILVIEHGTEHEGGVRFHAISLILLFLRYCCLVLFLFAAKESSVPILDI